MLNQNDNLNEKLYLVKIKYERKRIFARNYVWGTFPWNFHLILTSKTIELFIVFKSRIVGANLSELDLCNSQFHIKFSLKLPDVQSTEMNENEVLLFSKTTKNNYHCSFIDCVWMHQCCLLIWFSNAWSYEHDEGLALTVSW